MHLSDLLPVSALAASDLTFGYEHTADNINVKVNQSFFRVAVRPIRQGLDDG